MTAYNKTYLTGKPFFGLFFKFKNLNKAWICTLFIIKIRLWLFITIKYFTKTLKLSKLQHAQYYNLKKIGCWISSGHFQQSVTVLYVVVYNVNYIYMILFIGWWTKKKI